MRAIYLALFSMALYAGCASRDTTTTTRRDTNRPGTGSATTTTDSPRTTADRDITTQGGGTTNTQTTTQTDTTRRDVTVNRPVITDPSGATDADNTANNKRDADRELTKTPIDQNENQKDVDTTAEIRKRLTSTEASINAQNVKIMTQDGKVTLRGPVKNDEEKQMVERIAREVAGEGNVDNQLEIEKE
jgi:osmotically-inducible protein OsmY